MRVLLGQYLGKDWMEHLDEAELWNNIRFPMMLSGVFASI